MEEKSAGSKNLGEVRVGVGTGQTAPGAGVCPPALPVRSWAQRLARLWEVFGPLWGAKVGMGVPAGWQQEVSGAAGQG